MTTLECAKHRTKIFGYSIDNGNSVMKFVYSSMIENCGCCLFSCEISVGFSQLKIYCSACIH